VDSIVLDELRTVAYRDKRALDRSLAGQRRLPSRLPEGNNPVLVQ
jgi:hypothetical protein